MSHPQTVAAKRREWGREGPEWSNTCPSDKPAVPHCAAPKLAKGDIAGDLWLLAVLSRHQSSVASVALRPIAGGVVTPSRGDVANFIYYYSKPVQGQRMCQGTNANALKVFN